MKGFYVILFLCVLQEFFCYNFRAEMILRDLFPSFKSAVSKMIIREDIIVKNKYFYIDDLFFDTIELIFIIADILISEYLGLKLILILMFIQIQEIGIYMKIMKFKIKILTFVDILNLLEILVILVDIDHIGSIIIYTLI